ncbi:MAG: YfcE family phosphodiesterase, partial [Marinilabiliales bacterium]
MIRVGVISDTHGYMDEKILEHLGKCHEVWHAGDIGDTKVVDQLQSIASFRAVYGNIDVQNVRVQYPQK